MYLYKMSSASVTTQDASGTNPGHKHGTRLPKLSMDPDPITDSIS